MGAGGLAVQGMGRSMDAIWFNIGHTQFASPANSQLYMGIHLTLQGLRNDAAFPGRLALQKYRPGHGDDPGGGGVNLIGAFGFYFTRKLKPVADN